MLYVKALGDYIADCKQVVASMDEILTKPDKEVTLMFTENFDYVFKKSLVDISTRDNEVKKGFKLWNQKKNIYTGGEPAVFASQMFYLILKTADSYTLQSTHDVLNTIMECTNNSDFHDGLLTTSISEANNNYEVCVTLNMGKPLVYVIDSKESYINILLNIVSEPLVNSARNEMTTAFFKSYLFNECDKILENVPPTPYVERGEGVHLYEYFARELYRPMTKNRKFQHSNYDIDLYKQMSNINEECSSNLPTKKRSIAEPTVDQKKANVFYESVLISPMGKGMCAGRYDKKAREI